MGRRDKHLRAKKSTTDDDTAVIVADYCFFNDESMDGEAETNHTPILVAKCLQTGTFFSCLLITGRGLQKYPLKAFEDWVTWLGHHTIKFRSDGEAALHAFLNESASRQIARRVRAYVEKTPPGDSQAGGQQETAVQN